MSTGDQGLKTKHEVLKEYEKNYLIRLEKKRRARRKTHSGAKSRI